MDTETLRRMVEWMEDPNIDDDIILARQRNAPEFLIRAFVENYVTERLEREGWEFYCNADGVWWATSRTDEFDEKHPTKSAAVIAAFEHHTRTTP